MRNSIIAHVYVFVLGGTQLLSSSESGASSNRHQGSVKDSLDGERGAKGA